MGTGDADATDVPPPSPAASLQLNSNVQEDRPFKTRLDLLNDKITLTKEKVTKYKKYVELYSGGSLKLKLKTFEEELKRLMILKEVADTPV